jgi:hypothetical protein
MIMFDQSRRLSEPLRWGRRERTAVAMLIAVAAIALLGFVAYGLTSGAKARADCVDITFASTLGGAKIHQCGAQARSLCAKPNALHGLEHQLEEACKRAGFPFRGG